MWPFIRIFHDAIFHCQLHEKSISEHEPGTCLSDERAFAHMPIETAQKGSWLVKRIQVPFA
jgi:hypothetical protein